MGKHKGNVLIVGGLGYVGARLAAELGMRSNVWAIGRTLSEERKNWLARHSPSVSLALFDPASSGMDLPDLGFDVAINLGMPGAAEASADEGIARANALRTASECVTLLRNRRIKRLIHFSTFHVYGSRGQSTYDEIDTPMPTSAYGRIHLACEELLLAADRDCDITIVRPTNIVGAPGHPDVRAQLKLLFLDLCRQAVRDRCIRLNTDGRGFRDFVAMPDAISAIECLMESRPAETVMNLSSGNAVQLKVLSEQILQSAQAFLNGDVRLEFGTGNDPFTAPFVVTNSRLLKTGWATQQDSLSAEITATLRFFESDAA